MLSVCRVLSLVLLMSTPGVCMGDESRDCVIFLHGLARTANSMEDIADEFESNGFAVVNVGYPSRKHPVEVLAPMAIEDGLEGCADAPRVHFVTHSLGGILVRFYLQDADIDNLGRVVMLAPPNQGSEVVDTYRKVPGYAALNGPAGAQLGTEDDGFVAQLRPVEFQLGVIAGTRTFNPILSQSLPNPDDGKVSVASAKVEGMADFITVERSHPFIMKAPEVIEQAIAFIRNGSFTEAGVD